MTGPDAVAPGAAEAAGRAGRLVRSYFDSCNDAPADVIAGHFTADAIVYDLNHPPVAGAEAIGRFWVQVRDRWEGARWTVDSLLASPTAVAVEWAMRGTRRGRPFTAYGADHFSIRRDRIAEVRQYWVLDGSRTDTGLMGHPSRGGALPRR